MKYVTAHSKEFKYKKEQELWCKLCRAKIDSSRRSVVENHRVSIKHETNLSILSSTVLPDNSNVLKDMTVNRNDFKDTLIKAAHVAADISLKKFRRPEIKELFTRWEKYLLNLLQDHIS
ncbi:hypothetical protein NGRA_3202 [Nosema granulosis]|uniref:Uncharacterized protein n=1 Tax=Nosema granulosis TaxID=83296 RepID=A0A9P6GW94_9MICR|nr:hypothetical protein NGRA_3202 [Nosema granulosis]